MNKKSLTLALIFMYCAWLPAQAQEQIQEVEFNASFLRSDVDISQFSTGNPVHPGTYSVDLYLNNNWKGRHPFVFEQLTPGALIAQPCFDVQTLELLDIDLSRLAPQALISLQQKKQCYQLQTLLEGTSVEFDSSAQRLNISIPQLFLQRQTRNYVSPDLWDDGIPALTLQYDYNAYQSRFDGISTQSNQYLGLRAGANFGAWRLRQRGAFQWNNQNNQIHYQNSSIYLERGLSSWRSRLTIGQSSTDGQVFDSLRFRGVQLASDDRMFADTERGFAPVVRGIANSNALVTIRQNNSVIYETTVPPGAFSIEDLYPTGRGSDLLVTIKEADGSEHTFTVPYSFNPELLKPGTTRYSVMAGRYENNQISDTPNIFMGTVRHGFSNLLTGYTGAIATDGYTSASVGMALNTKLGAFSIDTTYALTKIPGLADQNGQNYRLSYAKVIPQTDTSLNISISRSSGTGYHDTQQALVLRDDIKQGRPPAFLSRDQKNHGSINISQTFPQGYGSLALNASYRDYWDHNKSHSEYQLSYNNNFKQISYSIAAQRSRNMNNQKWENQLMFSLSMPLGGSKYSPSWRFGATKLSDSTSFSNTLSGQWGKDSQFSYSVFENTFRPQDSGSTTSFGGTIGWSAPYGSLGLSASKGKNFTQYGVTASGAMVAYSQGIVFAPSISDTIAIVEAPHAQGTHINGYNNLKLDGQGKSIMPYLTPYRQNTVEINPRGLSTDVELQISSQNIVPTAGAVTLLKYPTDIGYSVFLHGQQSSGAPLPFGSTVLNQNGENIGYISQGSQAIIRVKEPQGRLQVQWGNTDLDKCTFDYRIDPDKTPAAGDFRRLEIICR